MLIQETLQTPQRYQCDVVVAGGGIAGISAALSAARLGADVLLLEREYMAGGLATAGLINVYLPLDDGCGHQMSYGIAEELLRLALPEALEAPSLAEIDCWLHDASAEQRAAGARYRVTFNPWIYAIAAEQLLRQNGVKLLYGVSVCAVQKKDKRVTAVIAEGKEGRFAIGAEGFVDATGDADLFSQAGLPTAVYQPGNLLAAWYGHKENSPGTAIRVLGVADRVPADDRLGRKKEAPLTNKRFSGLGCEELTDMMLRSHEQILLHVRKQREHDPAYSVGCIPVIPQVRMSRRIVGRATVHMADHGIDATDSVGLFGSWRERGPAYALPFGSLSGVGAENLFAAGRCISAADDVWDLTRVIPVCAVSGEAAGAAAALCRNGQGADAAAVQGLLRGRKIPLTMAEAGIV